MTSYAPTNGVYPLMSEAEYRAARAVNQSSLRYLARSPLHYRHYLTAPAPESRAKSLGALVHAIVLASHPPSHSHVICDAPQRRGKQYAADMETAAKSHSVLVLRSEWDHAQAIAAAVGASRDAMGLLTHGDSEVSAFWIDQHTQIGCKGRLDHVTDSQIVDLKTAIDISPRAMSSAIARYEYHVQAAYYVDGYSLATGTTRRPYSMICVESVPPYDVAVYTLPGRVIDAGRELYRERLQTLAECIRADSWPGIGHAGPAELDLPRWAGGGTDDDDLSGVGLGA